MDSFAELRSKLRLVRRKGSLPREMLPREILSRERLPKETLPSALPKMKALSLSVDRAVGNAVGASDT